MIQPAPPDMLPPDLRELAGAQLLAAADAQRASVCAALVAAHPEHRAGLERLLRKIQSAERLLAASFPDADRGVGAEPSSIAGHRVVRRLGQGAFGTVYLCRQEQPVARDVAVKVLRNADVEPQLMRRFYVEQQVLAALSHPAITQIYDAGALPDGRPFFVMEYVGGPPITEYCASRALDPQARLRLLVDVCRGVQHAHERGVLHRDLKPGNVLVVESGTERHPKIIDFGIAKAVLGGADEEARRARTETGRIMGTPGYMSPEQALGNASEIDARTDVFALGVLLYELLTGELPWPRGAWRETDTDPALPSVRITKNARRSDGDTTESRRLAARVRGDLDWITMSAVRRDREERYGSVRELADDLVRHLEGRPISAGPPSPLYRLRRILRRHRAAVLASLAALLIAAAAFAWSSSRTRDLSREAEVRGSEAATAVAGLLQRANDAALRRMSQHEDLRRALASDALAFYDTWLREHPEDPELRAGRCRALGTLCEVHAVLGQAPEALRTGEEATKEAAALLALEQGSVSRRALFADASQHYATALQLVQRFGDSLPHCRRAVEELRICADADPRMYLLALTGALRTLSVAEQVLGDRSASIDTARESIGLLEHMVERDIARADALQSLVWSRFTLAAHLMDEGEFDTAEALLAQAEEGLSHVVIDRLRITAAVLCQRAQIASRRRDHVESVARHERALRACEAWRAAEPDHFRALGVMYPCAREYARALEATGERDLALAMMRRVISVAEEKSAAFAEDPERIHDVRNAAYEFARALWSRFRLSDLAQAKAWLRLSLELYDEGVALGGSQRPLPWEARSFRALVGDSAGEANDAEWDALAAELPARRELGEEEPAEQVVEAWNGVARSRLRRGLLDGARAAHAEAEHYLAPEFHVEDRTRAEVAYLRARIALASGDFAAADAAVAEVLARRSSWWGRWRAGDCERAAWRTLVERGAPAEACAAKRDAAEEHYRSALDILVEHVAAMPDDPGPVIPWGFASLGLAEIEAERGERSEALSRLQAALAGLARVESEAHRDLWDAERVSFSRELERKLAGQGR